MGFPDKKRLLLVEDEVLIALDQQRALEDRGYGVITAHSGEKAVEVFKADHGIDLVLMDIDLGSGLDGTEAASAMLAEREIPVVFLSSHTEPEIVEKTERITSYGYVVKNSGITVLDASIKMAFKLFSANRALSSRNESLHHHFQLLENILENFPGFVLWKDTNSHFLGCNTNFAKKMGLSSPVEVIGRNDYDLPFLAEEVEGFLADDRSVMETRTPKLHFEEREHVAGGEEIFLDTCKMPLYDAEGQVTGILAVAMDITERRRAEESMQASIRRFDRLFEVMPQGVVYQEADGKITAANLAASQMLGLTPDQIMGRTSLDPRWRTINEDGSDLRGEDHPAMRSLQSGKEEGPFVMGVFHPLKDSYEWLSVCAIPFFREGESVPCGVYTVFDDITERKRAEESRREGSERIRLLLDSTAEAIYGIDIDGNCTFCNRACLQSLGYGRPEDLLGKNMHWLIHAKYPDGTRYPIEECRIYRAFRKGTGSHVDNEVLWRADGTSFPAEYWSYPQFKDGKIMGAVVTFLDITERRQAEEKIRNLLGEKELILKEVHHRIKNNMSTICALLVLQKNSVRDSQAVSALEDTERRIRSMMILYDRLYRAENIREMPVSEYLPALVRDIVGNFPGSAGVSLDMEMGDFVLQPNELQPLGIIINELVSNIMKHAFAGRDDRRIRVEAGEGEGIVTIVIADNGATLPESIDFSNSPGFGMQLVGLLAKQLGGSIEIERGGGTRFILKFKA